LEDRQIHRIRTTIQRPAEESYSALFDVSTGNVCDAMGRFGSMSYEIKPLSDTMQCVGTAVTVKARPCDNLIVYKALDLARPGDVLVIGVSGYTGSAVWGDITSLIAKKKNLAGMVTDGLVRDIQGIRRLQFPVFARGAVPNSPFKDGPGQINVPISCGGVGVEPGDIVVGDVDGVVIVPGGILEEVVSRALAIAAGEIDKISAIEGGMLIPTWVDQKLREKGYSW
jgi:regulator of RNase E activity RraA